MSVSGPEQRSSKRRRTEADDSPIVRCEELWFDDGNLVIQAGDTQYRVHRSILSKKSVFFNDLKAVAQSSTTSAEGTVEGCPVIELQDDVESVEYMLCRIYDTAHRGDRAPLTDLRMALRIGQKYLVPMLFANAVYLLRDNLPTSLAQWRSSKKKQFKQFVIDGGKDNVLNLLSVLREVGLETLLPPLYLLCLYNFSTDEIAAANGVQPHDQIMLMLARDKILHSLTKYSFKWTVDIYGSRRCKMSDTCDEARCEVRAEVFEILQEKPASAFAALILVSWDFDDVDLCQHCLAKAQQTHEEGLQKFWHALPSFFGLKPWQELRDFQIE